MTNSTPESTSDLVEFKGELTAIPTGFIKFEGELTPELLKAFQAKLAEILALVAPDDASR